MELLDDPQWNDNRATMERQTIAKVGSKSSMFAPRPEIQLAIGSGDQF
jgi:hypothetical protein